MDSSGLLVGVLKILQRSVVLSTAHVRSECGRWSGRKSLAAKVAVFECLPMVVMVS